jgi:heme exporter protein D
MTKRYFLAGLLGGIAMYVWTSVAHLVLPLGAAGIREIPNEQAVLTVMRSSIGDVPGLYFFPGLGQASMQQYAEKLANNPSGILVYHPPGAKPMTAGQLITEFLAELVESFLAVFLLSQTRLNTFASRLGFVTVAGVLAHIATNISYWNWYGFPSVYTAAYVITGILGFVCAGLVIAAMLRVRPEAAS